jgi:uncharacterized repeat protein (TIGR01451 family)
MQAHTMRKALAILLTLSIALQVSAQNLEWVNQFTGGNSNIPSMTQDPFGNLYLTGSVFTTTDFDPGQGVVELTSQGSTDCYVAKFDPQGNLLWVRQIGGVDQIIGKGIAVNSIGQCYVIGSFKGTVDLDPGTGEYMVTAPGVQQHHFVVKLDAQGNFVWAHASSINMISIALDEQGDLYVTGGYGSFGATVDFDPSPTGEFFLTLPTQYSNAFLWKLSPTGSFIYAKAIDGPQSSVGQAVKVDHAGNVVFAGRFNASGDFDPGTETFILSGTGLQLFVCKLTASGDFIWAKHFGTLTGSSQSLTVNSLAIDASNSIYLGGEFSSSVDFDPSTDQTHFLAASLSAGYLSKLDADGNFLWANQFNGSYNERTRSIAVDREDNVYALGEFEFTVDFDFGDGVEELVATNWSEVFIAKYDASSNLLWARQIGAANYPETPTSILTDTLNNLFIAGQFSGGQFDADPDPANTSYLTSSNANSFFLKLSQDSCANLILNVASVDDVSCTGAGSITTETLNGLAPFTYTWNTSPEQTEAIASMSVPGVYSVTITDSNNCTRTRSAVVSGPQVPTGFDLNANLLANNFRVGFPTLIRADAFNDACAPVSGSLRLHLDGLLEVDSIVPAPSAMDGDTLVWDFVDLSYDMPHLTPRIYARTSLSAAIGDTVNLLISITPLEDDQHAENNVKNYRFPVVNGYDPNDKQVYPQSTPVLNNETVTYTVRFQNTGNSEAINIYILDTLDINLDLTSVRVVGKSHEPMVTEVIGTNVLKFRFDNILLPDSTSNEPESHGHVIFEVTPASNVNPCTEFLNTASIFFDFNEPIITNTVAGVVGPLLTLEAAVQSVTCLGDDNGSIVLAVNGGQPDYSFSWSGISANSSALSDLPSGPYTVLVQDAGICSLTQSFDVEEGADVQFQLTGDADVLFGDVLSYTASEHPDYAYSWSVTGGTVVGNPSEESILVQWDVPGAGEVSVTATDSNGCSATNMVEVNVELPVQVSETDPSTFVVRPNPFSQQLTFAVPNGNEAEVVLYDIHSRLVMRTTFTGSISVDTEQLPSGMYIYELRDGGEMVGRTGKAIKY